MIRKHWWLCLWGEYRKETLDYVTSWWTFTSTERPRKTKGTSTPLPSSGQHRNHHVHCAKTWKTTWLSYLNAIVPFWYDHSHAYSIDHCRRAHGDGPRGGFHEGKMALLIISKCEVQSWKFLFRLLAHNKDCFTLSNDTAWRLLHVKTCLVIVRWENIPISLQPLLKESNTVLVYTETNRHNQFETIELDER